MENVEIEKEIEVFIEYFNSRMVGLTESQKDSIAGSVNVESQIHSVYFEDGDESFLIYNLILLEFYLDGFESNVEFQNIQRDDL